MGFYMAVEAGFLPGQNLEGISRRDFLDLAGRRRRQKGQPPRSRGPEISSRAPTPHGWRPLRLDRKGFLLALGGTLAGGTAIVLTRPWELFIQPEFMPEEAKRLGREVNSWRLGNGVLMSAAFPEIKQAADLLEGRIDPRKFIPQLKVPVGFSSEVSYAAFVFTPEFDVESPRQIKVRTNRGDEYTLPFLKPNSMGSFQFSPEILRSSIRLPIAAKEASQVVDHLAYSRVYVSLLKEYGTFTLDNPDNIPTTEEEFITSIAYAQNQVQLQETGSTWFQDFVDFGSGIRMGGIVFANWLLEEGRMGRIPQGPQVDAGHNWAGFMQDKGYIVERNGMFVWARRLPEIASKEFLQLFNEFTGRTS